MKAQAHIPNIFAVFCRSKVLLLVIASLLWQLPAQALFYEGFDYPDGEELGDPAGSPTWENDKSQFNIVADSLDYIGIESSTGNRVYVTDADDNFDGVRTEAFTPVSSGSLYLSFLLRVESAGSITTTGVGTPVLTIGKTSNGNQMLGVNLLNSGGMKVGAIKYPKSSTPASSAFFASGTGADIGSSTVLIVAKYEFVGGADNDIVTVWVNPDTSGGIEDPANKVTTSAGADGTSAPLGRLTLCRGPNVSIDEIRISDNWMDVTPTGGPLVASQLGFEALQQVSFVGTTLHPVVVDVLNPGGVLVPTNGVPVTLSLTAGSGGLNGTLTRNTGADGRAIFDDLSFDTLGTGKEITATSGILGPVSKGNLYVINDPDGGVVATSPTITDTMPSSGSIVLQGDGGAPNGTYQLITTVDLTTPIESWTSLSTNTFDALGNFSITNVAGDPHRFYGLLAEDGSGAAPHEGYASVPGPITGGGDTADIVVVTNHTGFMSAISGSEPRIVYVEGSIPLRTNGNTYVYGNKTIMGLGTNATLVGNLGIFLEEGGITYNATNIIIRNLTITNPDEYGEDDGITVKNGGGHLWVDHCTIYDCTDGLLDVTRGGDFVTVSWCRFFYTALNGHENVNLIGGNDDDYDSDFGKLHVTFHHNWWGAFTKERMPSVRYGRAHVFNNYFNSTNNNYCTRARLYSEVLVENNYYDGVYNPWELATSSQGPNGLLHASGNITNNCIFSTTHYNANLPNGGTVILVDGSDVLTPASTDPIGLNPAPYVYTLGDAADVKNLVIDNAGAGKGPFAP